MRVWPAPAHHLEFTDLPATSVQAGNAFSGTIKARDQFQNLVSTGPYTYTSTIKFDAETTTNGGLTNANQNPSLPPNYTFVLADGGVKNFTGGANGNFILKKQGSRWLKATDVSTSSVNTEFVNFSTRPYVVITPGLPYQFAISSPTDMTDLVADNIISVDAGNLSNLGRTRLASQLADQFDNAISSAGFPVSLSVVNVTGSTGTVRWYDGVSYNVITTTVTDASGQIGVSPAFYYFISTKAADRAQVKLTSGAIQGITLPIVTIGGTPSSLVFMNPPVSGQAGVWSADQFVLERRDDFGNPTVQNVSPVNLLLGTGQSTIHSNDAKTYYFTDSQVQATQITSLTFNPGVLQMKFSYYDTMTSTPAGEHGRLGTWQIRAEAPPMTPAVYEFTVNPGPTATVGVDNSKRTIEAGRITYQGVIQPFQYELWDTFGNPTVSTENIKVIFESTRTASPTNDASGFVLSSTVVTLPGLATNATSFLLFRWGPLGPRSIISTRAPASRTGRLPRAVPSSAATLLTGRGEPSTTM
jgi:hypothetical protein